MFPLGLYPTFLGCVLFYLRSPKGGCCSISDDLSCSCVHNIMDNPRNTNDAAYCKLSLEVQIHCLKNVMYPWRIIGDGTNEVCENHPLNSNNINSILRFMPLEWYSGVSSLAYCLWICLWKTLTFVITFELQEINHSCLPCRLNLWNPFKWHKGRWIWPLPGPLYWDSLNGLLAVRKFVLQKQILLLYKN